MAQKRERDEVEEEQLDWVRAVYTGTLEEALAALDGSGGVHLMDEKGRTALMHACRRVDDVRLPLVNEMLRRGAWCNVADYEGWTCLHFAMGRPLSVEIVDVLLKARAAVDAVTKVGTTPLILASGVSANSEEVLRVLLDHGADVNRQARDWTALLRACATNWTERSVRLLLERKANPNAETGGGMTALMFACQNRMAGPAMVPLLVAAGAKVDAVNAEGKHALHFAQRGGASCLTALKPYVKPNRHLSASLPPLLSYDPLGVIEASRVFGLDVRPEDHAKIRELVEKLWTPALGKQVAVGLSRVSATFWWALVRETGPHFTDGKTDPDVFHYLATSESHFWRRALAELKSTRHPKTGDTLLHVAARANNALAVGLAMRHKINPFLRNAQRRRAVDLTKSKAIAAKLRDYAAFRPTIDHAEWYGPYFIMRARTFLLVVQRLRATTSLIIPRDVVLTLLRHLASVEAV